MGRFHRPGPVKATKCVLMQPTRTGVTSRTPHSEQSALQDAGESARTDSKQATESIDSDDGPSDSEGDFDGSD